MSWILRFSNSNKSLKLEYSTENYQIPETMVYTLGPKIHVESDKKEILSYLACYLQPCRHSPCFHQLQSDRAFCVNDHTISWLEDLLVMACRVGDQVSRLHAIVQLSELGTSGARAQLEDAKNDACNYVRFAAKAALEQCNDKSRSNEAVILENYK